MVGFVRCVIFFAAGAVFWAVFGGYFKAGMDYMAPHIQACWSLDQYVARTEDIPDYRYHRHETMFGIHRKETTDAVNELYDRAHCDPTDTSTPGARAFKKITPVIVPDDRADALDVPRASASASSAATTPLNNVPVENRLPSRYRQVGFRKTYTLGPNGMTVTTTEEPAAEVPKPRHCGPDPAHSNIDYHETGCP